MAEICPICNRQAPMTYHHIVPKSFHRVACGLPRIGSLICRSCHDSYEMRLEDLKISMSKNLGIDYDEHSQLLSSWQFLRSKKSDPQSKVDYHYGKIMHKWGFIPCNERQFFDLLERINPIKAIIDAYGKDEISQLLVIHVMEHTGLSPNQIRLQECSLEQINRLMFLPQTSKGDEIS